MTRPVYETTRSVHGTVVGGLGVHDQPEVFENVILRTDGTAPEAGYTVSEDGGKQAAAFVARLDGSTPPVALPRGPTVGALSGMGSGPS